MNKFRFHTHIQELRMKSHQKTADPNEPEEHRSSRGKVQQDQRGYDVNGIGQASFYFVLAVNYNFTDAVAIEAGIQG